MEIKLDKISKCYGRKRILQDVSIECTEGECVGILGGNGCGKSTLLSVLAGVRAPSGGSFFLDGQDLFRDRKRRTADVGYLPQGTPLIEELSALDNLKLWYGREELRRELNEGNLKMLGIDEFLRVQVRKMSGGMKKRLSVGCAVSHAPRILLLDEPTAALDLICKEKIREYIISHKSKGGTVFLSTHDELEIKLCDRIFIIKDGIAEPYEFNGDIGSLTENF